MDTKSLSNYSENQRDEAFKRYHLIEPFINKKEPLTAICSRHKLSIRTARRWVTNYKAQGINGLIRQKRNDTGKMRSTSNLIRQAVEGMYLQSRERSIANIYRNLKEYLTKQDTKCPSYRTICHLIKGLPAAIVTLARQGDKAYKQQYDLLYRHEANGPNKLWQADHVLLDIFIIDSAQKPVKPWLTVIIDDYSRAIAGYELSILAPSAIKTSLCLRHAIWRKKEPSWSICGIPDTLYTDHGSDFTSHHVEHVCIDLKIQLIFSNLGEPRGRGKIERFFRTLNQMLLSRLSGYAGCQNPIAKLTLAELDKLISSFIEEYNQRLHPEIQKTPKARWEEQGFLPRMPESLEQLDLLLMESAKSRCVQRDGIRFQGLRYIDPILAEYVGESVIIRYNPSDITSIRVFYKNQYLCQPVCQTLDQQSVSLKEIQTARNEHRRNLKKQIAERLSIVDSVLLSKQK